MKKVVGLVKLQVPGGMANPSPPVGPALGQHGVNIMEFCKAFNARTQNDKGTIIRLCGAAPVGGAGTAGDSGDGGLAVDALLGQPLAVEVGPDDSIFVSSAPWPRITTLS